jgi:hypothetical protein
LRVPVRLPRPCSSISTDSSSSDNSLTRFQTYGFEYTPTYINGFGTGQITWTQGGEQMWKISDTAMAANTAAHVGNREVTGEPLYLLMNLGMSKVSACEQWGVESSADGLEL